MRRLVVATVCTLAFSAAAIVAPATSDAVSRTTLTPGRWTSTGPASTTTHIWTFTVPRTGYVLMRSTGAVTTLAEAPVTLTDDTGRTRLQRLTVQSSDSFDFDDDYATATRRLPAGRYALTGKPLKDESIRVDLIPNSVAVLDSSLARDNDGRSRVIGDVMNGTTVTRSGVKLHVTFRNAHGESLGHVTVSPLLSRIPQGGTDPVAAFVTPPRGTAAVTTSVASSGTQSHAVPGGVEASAGFEEECAAPPDSGVFEAVTEPEAMLSNTSNSVRSGLVMVAVDRDFVGETYEVDIAPVGSLNAGATASWGGVDPFLTTGYFLASPWLPIVVTATDTSRFARNPEHLSGEETAYAQASS